jgi:hypothetical protein
MHIRDAADNDLAAMVAVYNDIVVTSTAIYRTGPTDDGPSKIGREPTFPADGPSICLAR